MIQKKICSKYSSKSSQKFSKIFDLLRYWCFRGVSGLIQYQFMHGTRISDILLLVIEILFYCRKLGLFL